MAHKTYQISWGRLPAATANYSYIYMILFYERRHPRSNNSALRSVNRPRRWRSFPAARRSSPALPVPANYCLLTYTNSG
jgi:hypothetical protein